MAVCEWCGKEYDPVVDKAHFYDEFDALPCDWPDGLCFECARQSYEENMAAGLELDYELTTGRPGDDMPDDWEFNGDYD